MIRRLGVGAAGGLLTSLLHMGIGMAIDDFGTSCSSVVLLKGLSIQALKIDRASVADLTSNEQSRAIVQATIQPASNLGMMVVAEGVEDGETAERLERMGCDQAPDVYFARPAPAGEIALSPKAG